MSRSLAPFPAKKRCAGRCARVLPLNYFHHDAEADDGRQSYCPECKAHNTREARWLKYYGLRAGRAQRCLEIQNNACPLCGGALDFDVKRGVLRKWSLHVDHDHETGEVRGLLHMQCNISPPAGVLTSARWLEYCGNPPMREAHGGMPLIAPVSGLGEAQLDLAIDSA